MDTNLKNYKFQAVRNYNNDAAVRVIHTTGDSSESLYLDAKLDIINHSPTGFEWGYGGSGPSQLALAILYFVINLDKQQAPRLTAKAAQMLYQTFKYEFIARQKEASWFLEAQEVKDWLSKYDEYKGFFDGCTLAASYYKDHSPDSDCPIPSLAGTTLTFNPEQYKLGFQEGIREYQYLCIDEAENK